MTPTDIETGIPGIVYDTNANLYYNRNTDIFLEADDEVIHHLIPAGLVTPEDIESKNFERKD